MYVHVNNHARCYQELQGATVSGGVCSKLDFLQSEVEELKYKLNHRCVCVRVITTRRCRNGGITANF